ncbi:hypothetical protein PpBr36_08773 [Pyricularia pennisetigena]|uniref:hypothetical protein n=1 Tax=Pyricularia pennisetigena TaxID=1578925 RepID=UPI0011526721|nr:hypothetical protein PpBr36_08773 [Pyricularia pennisetigena]TLS24451.1 hypothetical protein PpBr36_08773 [Pyricularia pennisetigena]
MYLNKQPLLATWLALVFVTLVSSSAPSPPWISPAWFDDSESAQKPIDKPLDVANRPGIGYIALGDSYGAGIGTEYDGDENKCRLGNHAYTSLIYRDLVKAWEDAGGGSDGTPRPVFQWRSCTGATSSDLLGQGGQIASINSSLPLSFATLSIGGNDLGFFDVINSCIFRFYGFYSGTCAAAIRRATNLLDSPAFELSLEMALLSLLDAARWEQHPRFAVIVTGYARFFDARTSACDDRSLGVWIGGPKLSARLRARLNGLVDAVNARLRDTVRAVNLRFASPRQRVLFVDYDEQFEGHRFCEPGVLEPDYQRDDTWFFLVGGKDNGGSGGDGGEVVEEEPWPLKPPAVDPDTCLGPARDSGDWGALAVCYIAMAKQRDPSLRLARPVVVDGDDDASAQYTSVYYAKTFHPRSLGHEAIRDAVYREWKRVFDEDLVHSQE